MRKIFLILLLPLIFLLSTCKNDLQVNAPYKEYPSIYAVLCPQDKIQMIRINKVFMGSGNAFDMARVADSLNYPAGDITVTLERYVSDVRTTATPSGNKDLITFHDSIIQTQSGTFNSTQRVYVTGDRLFTSGEYRIKVYNNRTKNSFTAKANALDSVPYSPLPPLSDTHYGSPQGHYYGDPDNVNHLSDYAIWVNFSKPSSSYYIRFTPSPTLAMVFQMTMRLHYLDSMIAGNPISNYVDFNFSKQNSKDAYSLGNLGPFVTYAFKGSDIYETVASSLAKNSTPLSQIAGRRMYKIGFIIYSSTQEYQDYLDFNSPSLSIAQEKPLYSNWDNKAAIGLFCFRARHFIEREMSVEFKDEFATNANTCRYRFFIMSQSPPALYNNCP